MLCVRALLAFLGKFLLQKIFRKKKERDAFWVAPSLFNQIIQHKKIFFFFSCTKTVFSLSSLCLENA